MKEAIEKVQENLNEAYWYFEISRIETAQYFWSGKIDGFKESLKILEEADELSKSN